MKKIIKNKWGFSLISVSVFIILITFACKKSKSVESDNEDTSLIVKKNLPDGIVLQLSYEAETLNSSKEPNKATQISSVERINCETSVYKDGSFKSIINIIEPRQKIEGIQSLSPSNPEKDSEPAKKFIITPTLMTAYHSDGSLKFSQAINLPTFKSLLDKLKQPCYKDNPEIALSEMGTFSIKGDLLLSDCYQQDIINATGRIIKSEDGKHTIIRKPLVNNEISVLSPSAATAKFSKKSSSNNTKENSNAELRQENVNNYLEGNNPNNFDDVTIINNETKKIIGRAIYEGEEKIVMNQNYTVQNNTDNIAVVNTEYYVIDPITNKSRTDIIQISYDNVQLATNLE